MTPIDPAELLKLTPGTIRQLMLRGEIPHAEDLVGIWRINSKVFWDSIIARARGGHGGR